MSDYLTERDVLAALKVGRRTLYRWCASGKFPTPVRLPDHRSKRWRKEDVQAWEQQLLEERQVPPAVTV